MSPKRESSVTEQGVMGGDGCKTEPLLCFCSSSERYDYTSGRGLQGRSVCGASLLLCVSMSHDSHLFKAFFSF